MPLFFSHIVLFISEVHVDEETGMKRYPFELRTVPRLHWEDPTADHLMTHEVSNQSLLVFVGLQINSLGTSDPTVCESQPPSSVKLASRQCVISTRNRYAGDAHNTGDTGDAVPLFQALKKQYKMSQCSEHCVRSRKK